MVAPDLFIGAILVILVWALIMAGLDRSPKQTAFAHRLIETILAFLIGVLTGRSGLGGH